jgi:excisionase family DNA binding protein
MPPPDTSHFNFESLMFRPERRVLMVAEVAAKLRITEQHVIDLIDEGRLRAVNIGGNGRRYWRVPVEAYLDYLRARDSFNV